MTPFKTRMLASTVLPAALVLGAGAGGIVAVTVSDTVSGKPAFAACAPCNPCAAANPCNPCAAANPCNPCAAANPCNPCAAANPCSPCAAASPCNPCAAAASECFIPRLAKASAANPCNPCAAANPCNPCAAANPCNPCAAANPCNPCSPCGAAAAAELTNNEAVKAYDCVMKQMRAGYAKSGDPVAKNYQGWQRYSKVAYQSATHGNRYVQNYANPEGRAYGAFENAGRMPAGAILAKDSFTVSGKGKVSPGPLFIMEKMPAGFNPDGGNWKYTMIMPNGSVFGVTNGRNSSGMQFCINCHIAVGDSQDSMMLLPEEYRVQ